VGSCCEIWFANAIRLAGQVSQGRRTLKSRDIDAVPDEQPAESSLASSQSVYNEMLDLTIP